MKPRFLSLAEVLEIQADQIHRYGGRAGVRDLPRLQSALAMPEAGVGDTYVHGTLVEMAAAYLFHITQGHPFLDGNKRTGLASALVFLDLNSVWIEADADRLAELVEGVARGEVNKSAVALFLRDHTQDETQP